jgi:hypothetical protein
LRDAFCEDEPMRFPGQSHFKLRDDFVLKGHGFSRAEERS